MTARRQLGSYGRGPVDRHARILRGREREAGPDPGRQIDAEVEGRVVVREALQAIAAGVAPTADMNPILLKPEAESRSQVILNGRPWKTLPARTYYQNRDELWPHVTAALDRLYTSLARWQDLAELLLSQQLMCL